jgi:hypothetical protein
VACPGLFASEEKVRLPRGVPKDPDRARELIRAKGRLGAAIMHGNEEERRQAERALKQAHINRLLDRVESLRAELRDEERSA